MEKNNWLLDHTLLIIDYFGTIKYKGAQIINPIQMKVYIVLFNFNAKAILYEHVSNVIKLDLVQYFLKQI